MGLIQPIHHPNSADPCSEPGACFALAPAHPAVSVRKLRQHKCCKTTLAGLEKTGSCCGRGWNTLWVRVCMGFAWHSFPSSQWEDILKKKKKKITRQQEPTQSEALEQLPRAQLPVWGRIRLEWILARGHFHPQGVWGPISHPQFGEQPPTPPGPAPAALALQAEVPAASPGDFQGLNLCQTRELWP